MKLNWNGTITVNGVQPQNLPSNLSFAKGDVITLTPKSKPNTSQISRDGGTVEYRIKVKSYMTKKATPEFDFMAKWNNNNPMPLRVMIGTKEKETSGMVYMKLHGGIYARTIPTCMKCGKPLTNKVSQFFGIGPECGGHNYVNPFVSEEELDNAVKDYKAKLQNIIWEGWIIKSAIEESEEI